MKQYFRSIGLFLLLMPAWQVVLFSHNLTPFPDGDCQPEYCLVCVLSFDVSSAEFQNILDRYRLEEGRFGEFVNETTGMNIRKTGGRVSSIELIPQTFDGDLPFGIRAGDMRESFIDRFGPNEDEAEDRYTGRIDELIIMEVFFGAEIGNRAEKIIFKTIPGATLSRDCFTDGPGIDIKNNGSAIWNFDFQSGLEKLIFLSLNRFSRVENLDLKNIEGKVEEGRYLITFAKTYDMEEALSEFEVARALIDGLDIEGLGFSPDVQMLFDVFTGEKYDNYMAWKVSYVDESFNQALQNLWLTLYIHTYTDVFLEGRHDVVLNIGIKD